MSKYGIDISYCQGTPDFSKVKSAVDFVIMQIGYGKLASQIDKTFQRNYAECKKYNIPCGGYWFSYATTSEEARQEAKCCLAAIKGKKFEYPIYFDVEGKSLVGKSEVSTMCKAFCDELENAGYFAGIYISSNPAKNMLSEKVAKEYTLWLAEYGSKCNYDGQYDMWQHSSTSKVDGISGYVDTNYCYVDFPTIIKNGGYNGYKKKESEEVLDKTGFKRGSKGLGVYAYKKLLKLTCNTLGIKENLADDSGFGGGTEKATNAVLKVLGCKQNGIAGKNLINHLYLNTYKESR